MRHLKKQQGFEVMFESFYCYMYLMFGGQLWCIKNKHWSEMDFIDTDTVKSLHVQLAFCWANSLRCFLFQGPPISRVDQHLDSLGQPTQPLIFHNELGGTHWVLGREKGRSEQIEVRCICFCRPSYLVLAVALVSLAHSVTVNIAELVEFTVSKGLSICCSTNWKQYGSEL